jgi:hypothetical protein
MTAEQLLLDLRRRGYDLAGKDDCTRLVVIHSGTPLAEPDRELVRLHKDALLRLLAAEEPPRCWVQFDWTTPPIQRVPLTAAERVELRGLIEAEAQRLSWPELWDAVRPQWIGWERCLLEQLRNCQC